MTATVKIDNISHRYGKFEALKEINLTIEAGSFAVLLGPSGCGKTTLLSVLGGFLIPTSGRVWLDDLDVTDVLPANRPTTTMFQDYALFPHMTLMDNVAFGLRMRKINKPERHEKALTMLELVGLAHDARKKPHELSGGQRQRVALARALAVDPDVLLLDEPLGALDLKLRRQMQDELKAIQRRVGTTFVHVTHDQEEAMAIADTIIVMDAGRVEDTGSPESIYLSPKSLFSAGFMGEANILDATVNAVTENEITVGVGNRSVTLPASASSRQQLSAGETVGLCFRPEHFRRQAEGQAMQRCLDLGTVVLLDYAFFGTHQRCQMHLSNPDTASDAAAPTCEQSTLVLNLPQSCKIRYGETFPLLVDREAVVLLRK